MPKLTSLAHKLALIVFTNFVLITTVFAIDFPAYQGYVTDAANLLSSRAVASIEQKLKNYEVETGTEVAVLTIALIPDGMSANEYATALGNAWGVGKKQVDNGAILLIETDDAPGQRDIYIATGSQLEGGLTDLESRDIVDNVIIPRFQDGDFDGGVETGVDAILAALQGEEFSSLRTTSGASESSADWVTVIFFVAFIFFPWVGAILGRSKRVWPGGVAGAVGGGILGSFIAVGLATIIPLAIFFGLFGLLLDFIVSKNYQAAKKSGHSPSWWAGGGGFGSSGGSGGFGGFGGGGFSGGGGGGRW